MSMPDQSSEHHLTLDFNTTLLRRQYSMEQFELGGSWFPKDRIHCQIMGFNSNSYHKFVEKIPTMFPVILS